MVKANMAKKKGAPKKATPPSPPPEVTLGDGKRSAGEIIGDALSETLAVGDGKAAPAGEWQYAWTPVGLQASFTPERAAADATKEAAARQRRWLLDAGPSALAGAMEAIGPTTPDGAALKVTITLSLTHAENGSGRTTVVWEG